MLIKCSHYLLGCDTWLLGSRVCFLPSTSLFKLTLGKRSQFCLSLKRRKKKKSKRWVHAGELSSWDKTLLRRPHVEQYNNPEGESLWEMLLVKNCYIILECLNWKSWAWQIAMKLTLHITTQEGGSRLLLHIRP